METLRYTFQGGRLLIKGQNFLLKDLPDSITLEKREGFGETDRDSCTVISLQCTPQIPDPNLAPSAFPLHHDDSAISLLKLQNRLLEG